MIKVGIVGLGKMGKVRKAVIEANPDLNLVAICDINSIASTGYEFYHSYQELLKTDIDAVFVCTPHKFNSEITIASLNSGKHVFSEKPPGLNPQEVKNIIKAELNNPNLKLKFGFNHRYHSAIREAKRLIDTGIFGKILWMRGIYGKHGDIEGTWRDNVEIAGHGVLLSQGIHMLDLFRFFCGDFQEVKSFITNPPIEENVFALIRNQHGQVAAIHSSSTHWKHTFSLDIFLEKGYCVIDGILTSTRSYGYIEKLITALKQPKSKGSFLGNPKEEIAYFDKDISWELEVADFVDCINNDKKVDTGSSEDALKIMELIYKIYEADNSFWRES